LSKVLKYRDYIGSVQFSEEDNILYGKVIGITSLLLYEGNDITELINDFKDTIDEYIDLCIQKGKKPEVTPELQELELPHYENGEDGK